MTAFIIRPKIRRYFFFFLKKKLLKRDFDREMVKEWKFHHVVDLSLDERF